MRKLFAVILLLFAIMTMGACADDRHVYSPENRSVSINPNMLKYFPSGMDTNVAMADLIAVVKVKNDGEEFSYTMGEDIPERFQFTATATRCTFEIEDVWYGEVKKIPFQLYLREEKILVALSHTKMICWLFS